MCHGSVYRHTCDSTRSTGDCGGLRRSRCRRSSCSRGDASILRTRSRSRCLRRRRGIGPRGFRRNRSRRANGRRRWRRVWVRRRGSRRWRGRGRGGGLRRRSGRPGHGRRSLCKCQSSRNQKNEHTGKNSFHENSPSVARREGVIKSLKLSGTRRYPVDAVGTISEEYDPR